MVKTLRKFAVTGLAILLVGHLFGAQILFAQAAETPKSNSIEETFDVSKWLKDDKQGTIFVPNPDDGGSPSPTPAPGPGGATSGIGIQTVLVIAIGWLVRIIAAVSLIVFIFGALLTILSEGKEDRLEKGKTAMLYSIIGLVLALFAFMIVAFIQSIFY